MKIEKGNRAVVCGHKSHAFGTNPTEKGGGKKRKGGRHGTRKVFFQLMKHLPGQYKKKGASIDRAQKEKRNQEENDRQAPVEQSIRKKISPVGKWGGGGGSGSTCFFLVPKGGNPSVLERDENLGGRRGGGRTLNWGFGGKKKENFWTRKV